MLHISTSQLNVVFLRFDQVPNIRFNVAKGLELMAPVCGAQVYEAQIRPVLSLLLEDTDRDVRFFAERATKSLEEQFA